MCFNDAYINPDLVDQYVRNWYNNTTKNYSLTINVEIVDMHALLPRPYQILFDRYDDHTSSHIPPK